LTNFLKTTTIALEGKIKEYVAVARKKGNQWFIGAMTNWSSRDLTLYLNFLDANKQYKVSVLADGINAERFAEDYKISRAMGEGAGGSGSYAAGRGMECYINRGIMLKPKRNN
jgi:hypothetical protein